MFIFFWNLKIFLKQRYVDLRSYFFLTSFRRDVSFWNPTISKFPVLWTLKLRDRRQWDDWLHRRPPLKSERIITSIPCGYISGNGNRKARPDKSLRRGFTRRCGIKRTWHSMRRAWLFDCFRYECWRKTSWRYALNRSLNRGNICTAFVLNFAFCIRLPVLFFDYMYARVSICMCRKFKIHVHRTKTYISSYIALWRPVLHT